MTEQFTLELLQSFVEKRDWGQFHTPENLAKSISIEAGELLECFQWGSDPDFQRVKEELADVLTYAYLLASQLDMTPSALIQNKLEQTEQKYPVEKSRGRSTKYDRLHD